MSAPEIAAYHEKCAHQALHPDLPAVEIRHRAGEAMRLRKGTNDLRGAVVSAHVDGHEMSHDTGHTLISSVNIFDGE